MSKVAWKTHAAPAAEVTKETEETYEFQVKFTIKLEGNSDHQEDMLEEIKEVLDSHYYDGTVSNIEIKTVTQDLFPSIQTLPSTNFTSPLTNFKFRN